MIEFKIEELLPCKHPEIMNTIERKLLPSYESPLYFREELVVCPMNRGFYVEGGCGKFYSDSLNLLQSIKGKSAIEVCNSESDFRELEQYYYYGMIGYEKTPMKIKILDVNRKYIERYTSIETTWFSYIPLKIEIDLTRKCTQHCIHCSREASPSQPHGEMSLQDYVDCIKEAGKIGVPSLIFLGGEPTCHPDFIEIAVIAKLSGIRNLSTSTNGWLVDEKLARKMATLFGSIQVSIHGASSETHDRIVGREGAFSRACNAIDLFRKNNVGLLNISFTVMKENIQEMSSMVQLAKELGVNYILFLTLTPEGRGSFLDQLTDEEKEECTRTIKMLRDNNIEFRVEAEGFQTFCDVSTDAAFYGCPAGRTLMYINTDGDVKSCGPVNFTIGKIQESEIMDLWHSQTMVELRKGPTCNCSYNAICAKKGCLFAYKSSNNFCHKRKYDS